jgi:cellulose synthase/poly-beta-1,6-N-acetylglucosamine synthase-like glycosyltransferase
VSALAFWVCLTLVAYTYVGYALLVAFLARLRGTMPMQSDMTPPVSVVMTAYDEATRIARRVDDILAQDYPAQNLSVIVVSDGSNDGTERVAARDDPRVHVIGLPENCGKAVALKAAMDCVRTEFVVFADARQRFAPDALRRLLAPFADAQVGAVSGELRIVDAAGRQTATGLYWRFEKFIRAGEAQLGWLHGVSGAVYALRTQLFNAPLAGTVLDDLWIPLHVVFAGSRVWMARDAIAIDAPSAGHVEEYRRKLRTLAGNWQLLARLPRLLNPWRNPVFLPWLSHKLLRLIAPWALIVMWLSAAWADGPIYRLALYLQSAGYLAAVLALVAPRLASRIPLLTSAGSFVVLNAAALLALPASLTLDSRRVWKRH